jgi:glycosyltransferase involved in cell wall biosynthesis
MTIGIRYIGYGDVSGYALAALAYIRALHRAGVPVCPFFTGPRPSPTGSGREQKPLPLGRAIEGDASFADLPAIMRATARPIAYDTIVAHTHPEYWRRFSESGKRLVGYTVWETDGLPERWLPLLNSAERVLVPSHFNAELFVQGGVTRPVHVVPHIMRTAWNASAREEGAALRRRMGIPEDHFVFYTIGRWGLRKAMPQLIEVFAREFGADDRVTLLVKTSATVERAPARSASEVGVHETAASIVAEAARETGRPAPQVLCIAADDSSGATIEAIHAAGDAYVSLTHGEGWGLGAFDAATLGKPVIITGWGGQLDYLGRAYPGLVRYEMTPVEPHLQFRPPQLWATADAGHAAQLMRAAMSRDDKLTSAATSVREAISSRYAEEVVVRQFIGAINCCARAAR